MDFRKLSWIYYYLFTMLGVVLPGFTTCCIYYAFCMNNACSMYMLSKAALSVKDNQDCFQILSNYIPSFIYLFCIESSSFYFLFYTNITCVQSVVHNIFKKKIWRPSAFINPCQLLFVTITLYKCSKMCLSNIDKGIKFCYVIN